MLEQTVARAYAMHESSTVAERPEPETAKFYFDALTALWNAGVPFLVGGAYALSHYAGIGRNTKDLDLFVLPQDSGRTLDTLARVGFRTERTFPHWLGKAFCGDDFVDVIHSSGNGICAVDDEWFEHAVAGQVLGIRVSLCPVEEMIWQKSFIMERERFDGADIAHLLRACGPILDWNRLLTRFGPHWRVLFCHLVLFGFIYPAERVKVPSELLAELASRLSKEAESVPVALCQGTLLSRTQYLSDTEKWGYVDARLPPVGPLSLRDLVHWTAAAFETK